MLTLTILALTLSAPAKDDPKPDLAKQIIGEWHVSSISVFGDSPIAIPEGGLTFIFEAGGKVTMKDTKSKGVVTHTGTYKLDATKSPAELDMTPAKGEKDPDFLGIVKLAGETLIFCGGPAGKEGAPRPKAFESKKDDLSVLIELKKAKKDK
jgi:uncharacterized protein (TIGR03067 family)